MMARANRSRSPHRAWLWLAGNEMERLVDRPGQDDARWDGDDPGCYDPAGDAPAHGGEAARGPDAEDRGGDDLGGRDRDAEPTGHLDDGGSSRFGGKSVDRAQFDNAQAHRAHDAPATHRRAQTP